MASSRNSPSEAVAARVAERIAPGSVVCVGLSGGLDSVVLLDLLAGLRDQARFTLTALHVHHGLSPNADAWARFCEALCGARGIGLAVRRVTIDRDAPEGLEAAARSARYRAYASQTAGVVALAHHLDDQAETVLLQLLRGTGLRGAAAMPAWRSLPGAGPAIFRPLLDVPRAALAEHARERGLEWIEDESNACLAYDRNYLRHEIGPRLAARFPQWCESLARFARHAAAAESLLRERGEGGLEAPEESFPASRLRDGAPQAARALRVFLEGQGLPMPSEARLAEMARQLGHARPDARVRVELAGVALVRHRDTVRLDRGEDGARPWEVAWDGGAQVALGPGRGHVRFVERVGEGIAERYTHDHGWRFAPREGGERIRLEAARPTRTLKNLLQEHRIPAWQRERLPLLFHGEALVWVPGIGIAAGYRCASGEPGRMPQWLPAGGEPGIAPPRVLE